ncbi:hypothetical protein [Butyrivibrio sp. FC2001]|uniref:hypothetical protein n=1 Tax=Butyrivibrio sp. FC2001 TaxID=1280671 RepID=UPI0004791F47|nr:hypothetical protein [Butyrivibrio sp. FC2001]
MTKKIYINYNQNSFNISGLFPYHGDPIPEEALDYYGRGPLNKFAVFGILLEDGKAYMLIRMSRDRENRIIPGYYYFLGSNVEYNSYSKDTLAEMAYNADMTIVHS